MATKIDLRPYYELLHQFLRGAVEKHALKNPETVISTVGFYDTGYNRAFATTKSFASRCG